MAENKESLFRALTRLFRSGPLVKRSVRAASTDARRTMYASSALELFKKSQAHVYNNAINQYGMYDRMSRYADASEMEYEPIIAAGLDLYADESVAQDEKGRTLHIYSNNTKIKKLLEELFYDTLNIEFNLRPWIRNLCKFGDLFAFVDVSPDHGVINAFPIPVNEIEREEGYDPEDPMAVRFRWVTQGNQILENWQVMHMRLLGNDAFLPYGSSVLEPARRVWRQLVMIEDAMLVYRVVRSPERRIFYIDVGNVPPEDVPTYMEKAKATLRTDSVIDRTTGKVDLRHSAMTQIDDFFIPVRGGETGTRIDTLPGGTHVSAIEDVEYIRNKLFAAIKIPRAYLTYDESVGSKATLAQEDIRWARTVQAIQRVIISELNKLAAIHLFCHGYDSEDLIDFALLLSNPSTIAQQQKLEVYRSRFEIAAAAIQTENLVDMYFVRKEILGLTDDEIQKLEAGLERDKKINARLTALGEGGDEVELGGGLGAGDSSEAGGGTEAGGEGGEDLFASQDRDDRELLTGNDPDDEEEDEENIENEPDDESNELDDKPKNGSSPIKAKGDSAFVRRQFNRSRRRTHGSSKTNIPNFKDMLDITQPQDIDIYDRRVLGVDSNPLRDPFKESSSIDSFFNDKVSELARMTKEMNSIVKGVRQFKHNKYKNQQSRRMLMENDSDDDFLEIDIDISEFEK